jgi:hypothetical protein
MRTATPPRPEHRKQLLKDLLEEGIYGLDVLQSAVHLTASTLALPIPEVMARGMRLYTMPLGFMRENGREVPRFGSARSRAGERLWRKCARFWRPTAAARPRRRF